ncbi:hypothetical protein EES39_08395 [Streptomyces sp. ADI92-24]|nr:hypothetical protein EDD95_0395 [Streptomyces sp. CEV 2-1]RPK49093.1 hypothetical protein EES39_08395 [Streptomyces sp. ADI92-24]
MRTLFRIELIDVLAVGVVIVTGTVVMILIRQY